MERRLEEWVSVSSRTGDPVGIRSAMKKVDRELRDLRMKPVGDLTDERSLWVWETRAGYRDGTLLIGHMDIPIEQSVSSQGFRREPEWLFGEGIGMSRGPLVMLQFALRALRHQRKLHKLPVGILYYMDEGEDCSYSAARIREAASRAKRVLILRPGSLDDKVIVQRRGQRKYRLIVEGRPRRLGQQQKVPEVLIWVSQKLQDLSRLSSRKDRLAVSATNIRADAFPMLLPHRVTVELMLSYLDPRMADTVQETMEELLKQKGFRCDLKLVSDRPPMKERRRNLQLARKMSTIAERWEIPMGQESSVWPSVGGLVPASVPVVCGVGPSARNLCTPQESINRTSLIQRTLLIAQLLARDLKR
jgi:D-alanine-D-alanine ligase